MSCKSWCCGRVLLFFSWTQYMSVSDTESEILVKILFNAVAASIPHCCEVMLSTAIIYFFYFK